MSEEVTKAVETVVKEAEAKGNKEIVDPNDMQVIAAAKQRLTVAVAEAEKAAATAKIADLEYRSAVQHLFIKYKMDISDRIDDATGEIMRTSAEETKAEEVKAAE